MKIVHKAIFIAVVIHVMFGYAIGMACIFEATGFWNNYPVISFEIFIAATIIFGFIIEHLIGKYLDKSFN